MRRRQRRARGLALPAWLPRPEGLGRSGVRLVTAGLLLLSLWLIIGFVNQVIISAQMDRRAADLAGEITQIAAENHALATQVAVAQSPAYAEQVAREQLGYARDGDTVLLPILPAETPARATPTPAPIPTPPTEPNWHGWAQAFFPAEPTPVP